MKRSAALSVALALIVAPIVAGEQPSQVLPVPNEEFREILYETPRPPPPPIPETRGVEPPPSPRPAVVQPQPLPQVVGRPLPTPPPPVRTGRSLRGWASWYCSRERPICHYAYPPGSMVAAACGKLRRAMGPKWRGQYVTVSRSKTRFVVVRLVDSCASPTKTIDLYREPMRRLGGTGVLRVTVSWR